MKTKAYTQTQYPLIKLENCDAKCGFFGKTYLIFGLQGQYFYNYVCENCTNLLIADFVLPHCEGCGCYLADCFYYPTDSVENSQKPYCFLCFHYRQTQDIVNSAFKEINKEVKKK